ncbi:MAG TPA: class I SAM-dependent methyltransferase [candidate division Zixibacteria bacterium]|nr:class I SAM-dependent methyltransferase [candidate division Zixibacteria bacterium]
MSPHAGIYKNPRWYDIAFGFRNIEKECDFLAACVKKFSGRKLSSVVEMAAGPAAHSIEFGRRGKTVYALDKSTEMLAYARQKARVERSRVHFLKKDMRHFRLPQKVDLAISMMDSLTYLLTDEEILAHLKTAAANLKPKGLFVLELLHPRDFFTEKISFGPLWKVNKNGVKVTVNWGGFSDRELDPLSQVVRMQARLKVEENGKKYLLHSVAPERMLTLSELRLLVRLSGVFKIAALLGDLNFKRKLDNSRRSSQMVAVLKKI